MTHGARRAKGQRLQRKVAEDLSIVLGLTISAEPPTKPGTRPNGARYVAEERGPDLRIRRSGQPGDDVALLTAVALRKVTLRRNPLAFEVKNVESWSTDTAFRKGKVEFLGRALRQLHQRVGSLARDPVVVFGRNNYPPLALLSADPTDVGQWIEVGGQKEWRAGPILWLPFTGIVVPWLTILRRLKAREDALAH